VAYVRFPQDPQGRGPRNLENIKIFCGFLRTRYRFSDTRWHSASLLRKPGETTVIITVRASNIEYRGGGGVPERVPLPMAANYISGTSVCSNPEHTVNILHSATLKIGLFLV